MVESIPSPPPEISGVPDRDTKKGLPDYTNGSGAPGRVLHINIPCFSYGTNDRGHAAAIFLSIVLLVMMMLCFAATLIKPEAPALDRILTILSSTFTLTVGIAVGRGSLVTEKADPTTDF